MFNSDFYPTPADVIAQMLEGDDIRGSVVLEPSAGSGNIVDYLRAEGAAEVLACENDPRLKHIAAAKARLIAEDFITVSSSQVSHVQFIVMNPPFSKAVEHISHAFEIAPPGCIIISLCNYSNIENAYTKQREQLKKLINEHGTAQNIGDAFKQAERSTAVNIGLIRLQKPADDYETEFSGFFIEEEQEAQTGAGLMPYNFVRDIVNRYRQAVEIYDEQLKLGVKMSQALGEHFTGDLCFKMSTVKMPAARNQFKKEIQKEGWQLIFSKLNLEKYSTRKLRDDINKFVEHQQNIPFTMRNIYRMLDIVIGTTTQRMDKAIVDVFDKITSLAPENKQAIETWKTNSCYLLNKKFIINNMCPFDTRWNSGPHLKNAYGAHFDFMEDMAKAICFITGENWEKFGSLQSHCQYEFKITYNDTVSYYSSATGWNSVTAKKEELEKKGIACKIEEGRPVYGQPFKWAFFTIRAYKKGTMHFEFTDPELCDKFNARVAKIKGWQLPEKTNTAKNRERKEATAATRQKNKMQKATQAPAVLFEIDL